MADDIAADDGRGRSGEGEVWDGLVLDESFIRDAEVTDAVPQKNCATTAMSSRNSAHAFPSDVVQM